MFFLQTSMISNLTKNSGHRKTEKLKIAAGHWPAAVFRIPVFQWLAAKQRLVTFFVFCFNLFKILRSVAQSHKILLLNQPKFYVQLRTTTTQKTSHQMLEVLSFTTKCNAKCFKNKPIYLLTGFSENKACLHIPYIVN